MKKPYVICHMLTSLDGKITGEWFGHPGCSSALERYNTLRSEFNCTATIYGTTTMAEGYSDGLAGSIWHCDYSYPREDWIADAAFGNYIVSLDPQGILGWNSGYIEKRNRPKAHVIEVLTEEVSNDYLGYLHSRGVSYLFAGHNVIDCGLLLYKLSLYFGIERILLAGGGITNWCFASENLIDELSIVVAPVADGSTDAVSIFENPFEKNQTISMNLKEAAVLENHTLWLRYCK